MSAKDVSEHHDTYFSAGEGGRATKEPTWVNLDEIPSVEFTAGLGFRHVLGDGVLVNFIDWQPGVVAPVHAHEEEQIVIGLEGEFEMEVAGEKRRMGPGSMVVIPAWVPHGARSFDAPARNIDIFCPPRKALLEAIAKSGG